MTEISDLPTDDDPTIVDPATDALGTGGVDLSTPDAGTDTYTDNPVSFDSPPDSYDPVGDDQTDAYQAEDAANTAIADAPGDYVPDTQIQLTGDGQLVDVTPGAEAPPQPPGPDGAIVYDGSTPIPDEHNPIGMPIHPDAPTTDTVTLPPLDGPNYVGTEPSDGHADLLLPTGDTTTAPPGPEGGLDPSGQQLPPEPGSPEDTSGLVAPADEPSTTEAPAPGTTIGPFDASKIPSELLTRLEHDPTGDTAENILRGYMVAEGLNPDDYLAEGPGAGTDEGTVDGTGTEGTTTGTGIGDPANTNAAAFTLGDPNPEITPEQAMGLITQLTGGGTPGMMGGFIDAVDAAAADGHLTAQELAQILRDHNDDIALGVDTSGNAATPSNITDALNGGREVVMFVERPSSAGAATQPVDVATFRGFDARTSTYQLDTSAGDSFELSADDLSKVLTAAAAAQPAASSAADDGDSGGLSGLQMAGIGTALLVPAAVGATVFARRRQASRSVS